MSEGEIVARLEFVNEWFDLTPYQVSLLPLMTRTCKVRVFKVRSLYPPDMNPEPSPCSKEETNVSD